MKQKKVYVSGPMTGLTREVYMQRFEVAAETLRYLGYRVCNPAQTIICRWPWLYRLLGYDLTLKYDLWLLRRCSHIYLMPGWIDSRGAREECGEAIRCFVEEVSGVDKQVVDNHVEKFDSLKFKTIKK